MRVQTLKEISMLLEDANIPKYKSSLWKLRREKILWLIKQELERAKLNNKINIEKRRLKNE